MLKKINVVDFIEFIQENLDEFQEEIENKNFSNRNQKEWMILLRDYLGLNKPFDDFEIEENEAEIYNSFYDEDEDENDYKELNFKRMV